MKKIDLGQALTILANIGVIGGLIFVGFQLRQDREIAIVDSVQSATSARISWSESVTANGDIWERGLADESLTAYELNRFDVLANTHQLYYFGNWLRNQRIGGSIARERWIREMAFDIVENPGLKKWWGRFLERLTITTPDGYDSEWTSAVAEAVDRLERSSE